ncbi:MAG: TatD family hydrolase [Candidatus Zhuqueibacterota bacterium]
MDQKSNNFVFVDSHAHIDFDSFDNDRDQVVQNARLAKLGAIVNIGVNLETSKKSIALAEKYDMLYASVGVHPHDAHEIPEVMWTQFRELYRHPGVVAMGEFGLDYYRNYSPHDIQQKTLVRQLDLAVEFGLPVVIHTRNAWPDMLRIVSSEAYRGKVRGVFHCFSGSAEQAKSVLDLGYHISFTGVVTFKNSTALTIAANYVPLDRLMLETDCPFMAPEPHRGKRCEPAYIPLIAEKIASARGIALSVLANQTTDNAARLFGIEIVK